MGIYYARWDGWVITRNHSAIYHLNTQVIPSSTKLSPLRCVPLLSLPSLRFRVAVEVNNVLIVSGRDNTD